MRRAKTSGTLAVCALGLVIPARPAAAAEWTRSYTVSGTPRLRVVADDASVTLTSGSRPGIEVRVVTEGWEIGNGGVTVTDRQAGDRVELEVRVPNWQGLRWGRRSVKIELMVPRQMEADVQTGDGSITARELAGPIRLHTGDGSISVQALRGDVRLHTGDGSIEGQDLDGSLVAVSGDGSMRIRGRFDRLDLATGDGSIQASVESGSKVTSGWSLRSGDGSITVRLPEALDADLDAHTGDGHVVLDMPVTVRGRVEPTAVRGRLGSGGPPLTLRSGDGSIRIERL